MQKTFGLCTKVSTQFEMECRELTFPEKCANLEVDCPFTVSFMNYECPVWQCDSQETTPTNPLTTISTAPKTLTTTTIEEI